MRSFDLQYHKGLQTLTYVYCLIGQLDSCKRFPETPTQTHLRHATSDGSCNVLVAEQLGFTPSYRYQSRLDVQDVKGYGTLNPP